MPNVHLPAELQHRAQHFGRIMKTGLRTLWVVAGALVTIVGGSLVITAAWGAKHLLWGLVIALIAGLVVLTEGSYREFRDTARIPEDPNLLELRRLATQGRAMRARLLPPERRGLTRVPDDLTSSFRAWKTKVATALEPWPESLTQFQGSITYTPNLLMRGQDAEEIEQRTTVLDEIVRAITEQGIPAKERAIRTPADQADA
jgi:hypothetical protein